MEIIYSRVLQHRNVDNLFNNISEENGFNRTSKSESTESNNFNFENIQAFFELKTISFDV